MSPGPLTFPVLRWFALVWMVVWLPAYSRVWGWANLLHLCDVAVILTFVGIWLANPLLLSSQAVGSLAAGFFWILDAGAGSGCAGIPSWQRICAWRLEARKYSGNGRPSEAFERREFADRRIAERSKKSRRLRSTRSERRNVDAGCRRLVAGDDFGRGFDAAFARMAARIKSRTGGACQSSRAIPGNRPPVFAAGTSSAHRCGRHCRTDESTRGGGGRVSISFFWREPECRSPRCSRSGIATNGIARALAAGASESRRKNAAPPPEAAVL